MAAKSFLDKLTEEEKKKLGRNYIKMQVRESVQSNAAERTARNRQKTPAVRDTGGVSLSSVRGGGGAANMAATAAVNAMNTHKKTTLPGLAKAIDTGAENAIWARGVPGVQQAVVGTLKNLTSPNVDMALSSPLMKNNPMNQQIKNDILAGQKKLDTTIQNIAAEAARRQQYMANKTAGMTGVEEAAFKLSDGVFGMLPAVGVGMLTKNPVAAKTIMSGMAGGASANQALNEGASIEQAVKYGTAEAVKEYGTESLTGGLIGLGGGIINPRRIIGERISNPVARTVAGRMADSAGEGMEEVVSTYLTPYLQRHYYNPDAKNATKEELGESAVLGAAVAAIMGIPVDVYNGINSRQMRVMQGISDALSTNEEVDGFTENLNGMNKATRAIEQVESAQRQHSFDYNNPNNQVVNADLSIVDQAGLSFVQQAAEKTGLRYRIVEGLPEQVNAYIENGTIVYNANKLSDPATVRYTTGHEIYHAMRGTSEHAEIEEIALQFLSGGRRTAENDMRILQRKIDEYANIGKQLTEKEAMDEIGAEFMQAAFVDEQLANRILVEQPGLYKRIWYWISDKINMFRKSRNLSVQEKEQLKLLQQAQKVYVRGMQKINLEQTGAAQYSIDNNFRAQLDKWISGNMKREEYFKLGVTPDSLKVAGAKKLPLIMLQDVIVKITGGKHSISLDELAKLPSQIANPVMIFKGSTPNSIVVLTEVQDKSGNEVIAAIHLEKMQDRILVNKLASTYGKGNIENYVNRNIELGNLIDADKTKAPVWFTSRGLQLPKLVQTITDAKLSIPQKEQESNNVVKNESVMNKGLYSKIEDFFTPEQLKQLGYEIDDVDGSNNSFSLATLDERGKDPYQQLLEKYGAIEPGENPYNRNKNIQTPRQTDPFSQVSRFTRTAMEAEQVEDESVHLIQEELADDISSGRFVYTPISNQKAIHRANERIQSRGWQREYESWDNRFRDGSRMNKYDIAIAERLIQEAQNAGDYQTAVKLIADLAAIGTEMGQSVQALSMLKRLTPEGRLMTLQRTVERINGELLHSGQKTIELPEEIAQKMLQAGTQEQINEVWDEGIQALAEQMPIKLSDKIIAWRYLAMLGNPRTHFRNILGNAVMMPVRYVKDAIGTGIEHATLPQEQRTKALHSSKELKDYAEKNFEEEAKDMLAVGGSKYGDTMGEIREAQQVFKTNGLEYLRNKNSEWLEKEDMLFKKPAYISRFARFAQARGWTVEYLENNPAARQAAQNYAIQEAKKATFQETSDFANALNRLERTNSATKLLIGSTMPFKKTPVNILKRGIEYSPVGIVNGTKQMAYDLKKGDITKAEAIDSISAGMTGTMIMALGYFLASMGWAVAGSGDEGQRKESYDRLMGEQEYALTFSDGSSYTIDWLAPSAMPLLVGVELYNQFTKDNEEPPFPKVIHAITKIADPVLEMSMLSGLTNALRTYQNDTSAKLSDYAYNIGSGYLSQFLPTIAGQVARTVDDTKRTTYAPKDSPYTQGGEKFVRQQLNKIPGASFLNEASIDAWGREVKQEFAGSDITDFAARALMNMVSPGIYKSSQETAVDRRLQQLYKTTGANNILPKVPDKTFIHNDKNYVLDSKQYTRYAKTAGQKKYSYVGGFMNSDYYKQLSNDEKAKVIGNLYELANYEAKKQALRSEGVNYSSETYEKVLSSGVKPYEYYAVRKLFDNNYDYEEAAVYKKYCDRMDMEYNKFIEVMTATNTVNMVSDRDAKGKEIKGRTRQDKVRAYLQQQINAGNMTREQAEYVLTKWYPSRAKNSQYSWIRQANQK